MGMMISPMMQLQAQEVVDKDDIVAVWIDDGTKDTLEIYKVNDKFWGKIVGLKEPIDLDTQNPFLDKYNPDPALRTRPIKGLIFVKDCIFVSNSAKWEGSKFYNFRDGKTDAYEMKFPLVNNKDILIIINGSGGRTTYWTKKKTN